MGGVEFFRKDRELAGDHVQFAVALGKMEPDPARVQNLGGGDVLKIDLVRRACRRAFAWDHMAQKLQGKACKKQAAESSFGQGNGRMGKELDKIKLNDMFYAPSLTGNAVSRSPSISSSRQRLST